MISVTLYWWYIPLACALLGIYMLHRASRAEGFMGGMEEMVIALVLFAVALSSVVTAEVVR